MHHSSRSGAGIPIPLALPAAPDDPRNPAGARPDTGPPLRGTGMGPRRTRRSNINRHRGGVNRLFLPILRIRSAVLSRRTEMNGIRTILLLGLTVTLRATSLPAPITLAECSDVSLTDDPTS